MSSFGSFFKESQKKFNDVSAKGKSRIHKEQTRFGHGHSGTTEKERETVTARPLASLQDPRSFPVPPKRQLDSDGKPVVAARPAQPQNLPTYGQTVPGNPGPQTAYNQYAQSTNQVHIPPGQPGQLSMEQAQYNSQGQYDQNNQYNQHVQLTQQAQTYNQQTQAYNQPTQAYNQPTQGYNQQTQAPNQQAEVQPPYPARQTPPTPVSQPIANQQTAIYSPSTAQVRQYQPSSNTSYSQPSQIIGQPVSHQNQSTYNAQSPHSSTRQSPVPPPTPARPPAQISPEPSVVQQVYQTGYASGPSRTQESYGPPPSYGLSQPVQQSQVQLATPALPRRSASPAAPPQPARPGVESVPLSHSNAMPVESQNSRQTTPLSDPASFPPPPIFGGASMPQAPREYVAQETAPPATNYSVATDSNEGASQEQSGAQQEVQGIEARMRQLSMSQELPNFAAEISQLRANPNQNQYSRHGDTTANSAQSIGKTADFGLAAVAHKKKPPPRPPKKKPELSSQTGVTTAIGTESISPQTGNTQPSNTTSRPVMQAQEGTPPPINHHTKPVMR